jgi:ATP citrate (pro-S)-lyase
MKTLADIRRGATGIVAIGSHPALIQSVLDFDYLSGKAEPSVIAVITVGRTVQKFFFGGREVLIPCFPKCTDMPPPLARKAYWLMNLQSGRRALASTYSFFDAFPHAVGAMIFAENVPERHERELIETFGGTRILLGPASVGFLVPGVLKLGPIGGVTAEQIADARAGEAGHVAVFSTSGGMTNELINAVVRAGKRISFAAAVGGERFPVTSLTDLCLMAEHDPLTKAVVYFGELGGEDEYEIVELIRAGRFTKPLVAYIAGTIDEAFEERVQFGHAKALAMSKDESARAKREALRAAGALAPETFSAFLAALKKLPSSPIRDTVVDVSPLMTRTHSILSTRTVADPEKAPSFVSRGTLVAPRRTFAAAAFAALLGRDVRSPITAAFAEAVFSLLIDHGGQVSGAVNTMITARAGKDMVSSLASGLLTIGPRFGGAINAAADVWLDAVAAGTAPEELVAQSSRTGERIPGIGHKKYRVGIPDPRVKALAQFASLLKKHPHYDVARAVEKVATGKNGSLILNVDGCLAAFCLDILAECEGLSEKELRSLARAEFFNALFVIPRSVGFIAHFLEQKENDEGLFRLPDELLFVRENTPAQKKKKRKK